VIIGVSDPFEYIAHLYLYAHLFTTGGNKIQNILRTGLHMYRVITIDGQDKDHPLKTHTTPLTIEFNPIKTKLTVFGLVQNSKDKKVRYLRLARVAHLKNLIIVNTDKYEKYDFKI